MANKATVEKIEVEIQESAPEQEEEQQEGLYHQGQEEAQPQDEEEQQQDDEAIITEDELAAKMAQHRTVDAETDGSSANSNALTPRNPKLPDCLDEWLGPCLLPEGGICHDASCSDLHYAEDGEKIRISHCKYKPESVPNQDEM